MPQSKCAECGSLLDKSGRRGALKYCTPLCREKARARSPGPAKRRPATRGPLADFAKNAGWSLRRDVERLERIFADDRFGANKEQVATHLRSHLEYAAEVCQDLLSRITTTAGE